MISILKSKFLILGFVMVAVLLIPANDAFADVPSPITNITVGHPSGTIIEWDMDYNSLCADYGMCYSGFHMMTIHVASLSSNGFIHYPVSLPESGAEFGGHELIKEGTYDYKLKLNTVDFPDGNYRLDINFQYQPGSTLSGSSEFTIASPSITPPVVSVPNDVTLTTGIGFIEIPQNFPPTATDDVDGNLTVTCNSGGNTFPAINGWGPLLDSVGVHSITCSATDSSGYTGSASFTITVTDSSADTTPPVVSVPNDFTFTTTDINGNGLVTIPQLSFDTAGFPPTATDDVDGNVDAFCSGTNSYTTWDHWAGWGGWIYEAYPFESTPVTCTATDSSGNVGTASFTITVTEASADIELITPTVTASAFLNSTSSTGRTLTVNMGDWRDELTANVGGSGWQVLYKITDPNGIMTSINDPTSLLYYTPLPVDFFFAGYSTLEHETQWSVEILSSWEPGVYTITSSVHSGATWNDLVGPYSTTVTIPALDSADTTPPVITITAQSGLPHLISDGLDFAIVSGGESSGTFEFKVSAIDNIGVMVGVTCSSNGNTIPLLYDDTLGLYQSYKPTGELPFAYPVGSSIISCTGNGSGNVGSASFTVTVTDSADTTPPVLSLGSLTGTSVVPNSSIFDLRDVMKTEITATDASGISTIPPAISVSSTFPNGNSSDQIKDDGNDGMVWCDNSQYWYNGGVVITLPVGETTIKCAVWDNSENFTIESFTLVVLEDHVDTTPSQSYTVLVNEMGGSIAANDPGGCASFNPQTCYTPSDITINVGDSVTWVNNDSTNNWYTLMGNWGSLASSSGDNACDGPGKLALDMCGVSGNDRTSWTHTFDAVGTYNYHDWVYQNSAQRPEGVVNVVASGAPAPVTPVTPTPEPTSDSLNSYTEPHSGFVFKYPDSIDGIQILSMQTVEDYGVCDNCIRLEYTVKNTLDDEIRTLHLMNQGFIVANNEYTSGYVMNVRSDDFDTGASNSLESGEIAVLWTRVNWDGLPSAGSGWPCGINQVTVTYSQGQCEAHITTTSIDFVESWQTTTFSGTAPEIIITADKTTLDRTDQSDFANVAINYQGLNGVADVIIKTPDGIDHIRGGFSTSAYLTTGQQGYTEVPIGIYEFTNQFNSFMYIIDDGATRGELEFQIIGDIQILANHTITTVAESGFSQDCVETGCYTPSTLTVDVGDLINMTNTDPTGLPHTFTAGTVDGFAQNPSGVFDSGFMEAGDSFTWTPQTDVDQPYYCMLHVWMVGTIVVGGVDVAEQIPEPEPVGETWGELGSVYHRFDGPYDFLQTQVTSNIIRSDVIAEILLNGEVLREYTPATDHNGAFYYSRNITDDPAGIFEFRLLTTTNDLLDRECYSWNGFIEHSNNKSVNCNTSFPIPEQIAEADTIPPVVEEMTVSTSKEVSLGELLKISIIASHKTSVTIEIIDPSGNIADNTLSCNTTKEFTCETFWLVPEEILPGMYTVKVNDGIHSDQITFDVEGESFPIFITGKQNITLDATTTSNGAIVNYELPQATIPGSGVDLGITCTPSSGSFFQTGTTEVTCSASDWVGNVGTTSFTVTVNSLIAAPVEITTDVSITIGKSVYNTDEAIFVTGVATPFTENNVSIQVEDSSDNVVLVEQITPESSGIYTGIIFPNFLWSTSGNYTMSATYGNSTANTSFGFEFIESVIDEYLSPTGITLQTDTSMYAIGDTITIESALTDVGSDYQIGIFVEDPTGELRVIQFLNTDDSGSVSLSLKAQDNWIPGKYFVIASDTLAYDTLGDSENTRESVSFDLVKPIPEITISPTVTTTESGNTITSYDAGDMAYFSTSLLSESTSDVLVTINVVDADDTTLGVAFFKSIIGKGNSELVLGFKIPEDAADGAAKIYVNTYTDWIDNGGIVIGSELLSEVNIDGVIIEVVEETVVEEVVEETVLPENTIPRLSTVTDITQLASFTTGSVVSYSLPLATSGATTLDATCTPAPGSMFPIGSTQVTCTATNDFGNTGMTSFMVTINPILQTADQSLSVKVGKDLYNNLEPLFVTGSVGTVTGEPINLEVRDTQNNLISIEQTTPKESGVYSTVLTSNKLWDNTGEYTIIAKYEGVIALDTFEFKLVEVEEVIPEKIPTSLFIDTLDSAYVLGDVVGIGVNLVDAGAGEPILLEIKDSQNDQVLIQSLNTDSDGIAVFLHQLDSSGEPGVYSVTATSDEWSFSNSENFIAVAQIPDITIGDVVSTLQDGTEVDSFESGDMGYFQTPVISESVSDVLITVNIFDVENTPLGLAYFNSKVVDDSFDITLGLQIPQDAAPGLATVYINTYTDWVSEGGVPILEEQVSFIEITPSSTTSLTVSSEESESTPEVELIPITGNISVNMESTSYTTGNSIVISGSIQNLTEYEQSVVILIVSPDGNLVSIDQVSHDSSGNYSTTVTAGGTMNSNGEYEVRAQYGASKITSTFDFTRN